MKKVCSPDKGCGTEKDIGEFVKCGNNKDGSIRYRYICKECHSKRSKQYYQNNTEKENERSKQYYQNNTEKVRETYKQWYQNNFEKQNERKKQYRQNNPEKVMLVDSIRRAKKKGLEHNIELEDIQIPEYCPVLGIKLEVNSGKGYGKAQPNSPSLDRVDNSRGYTKDNIRVISYRANMLKNNATQEELEKVLDYMKRYQPSINAQ